MQKFGKTDVWIETGIWFGETTNFLTKNSNFVYPIELEKHLAQLSETGFERDATTKIIHGTSEEEFEKLLSGLECKVSIYLDGHYSAEPTFKGIRDTPVRQELYAFEKLLVILSTSNLLIDDFRCFDPENPEYKEYPSKQFVVNWNEKQNLKRTVQHVLYALHP